MCTHCTSTTHYIITHLTSSTEGQAPLKIMRSKAYVPVPQIGGGVGSMVMGRSFTVMGTGDGSAVEM